MRSDGDSKESAPRTMRCAFDQKSKWTAGKGA